MGHYIAAFLVEAPSDISLEELEETGHSRAEAILDKHGDDNNWYEWIGALAPSGLTCGNWPERLTGQLAPGVTEFGQVQRALLDYATDSELSDDDVGRVIGGDLLPLDRRLVELTEALNDQPNGTARQRRDDVATALSLLKFATHPPFSRQPASLYDWMWFDVRVDPYAPLADSIIVFYDVHR